MNVFDWVMRLVYRSRVNERDSPLAESCLFDGTKCDETTAGVGKGNGYMGEANEENMSAI